jgi:flagellar biogenesis protein FliO
MRSFQESRLGSLWARLRGAWQGVSLTRRTRRLRLCESLALGEKRLLALVECEGQRLLVAVTSQHISVLQALRPESPEDPAPEAQL